MAASTIRSLSFLLLCVGLAYSALAQDEPVYPLADVIVTASRTPVTFSDLARSVMVIDRADIAAMPVRSVEDILARALSVDVRQRGASGVQADVGIRGGTFEQTLVLIDGIKVSDPQTGHHSLDLPLAVADIERVEILRGPGSKLYGPNALGGVINIITKKAARSTAHLEFAAGEHGLFEQSAALSCPLGFTTHRVSAERRTSTGFRDNTEFDIKTLAYTGSILTRPGIASVSARYTDKAFGAHTFYSDAFPDEWEATETALLTAGGDFRSGRFTFAPRLNWRRHEDDFILDRSRPDWYRNRHTTDHYGAEMQATLETSWGMTALGGEIAVEEITSSNLGDHSRHRAGIFGEHRLTLGERLTLVPGVSVYHYTDWGWQTWPGFDAAFRVVERVRLYFSVGKSYRVPTYTELYYQSAANLGNPDLRPEKSWTYEWGGEWQGDAITLHSAIFIREGTDLIDWARADAAIPWKVENVSRTTTRGMEGGALIKPRSLWKHVSITGINVGYTFLDSDHTSGAFESKYVRDHLKHQLIIEITNDWPFGLRQGWTLRYLDRLQDQEYLIADTRLMYRFRNVELFAEATNLFNTSYSEIGAIPQPGRWLRAGVKLDYLQ